MTLATIFLTIFIIGPLVFRLLTRRPATTPWLRRLAVMTAVAVIAGLAIRFGLSDLWGQNLVITVIGMALVWFAWIGILAYGALVLRRYDPGRKMHRWTAVMGAIGTTIPWFGLASAAMISG